ncbi:condensation domain-containing protein [Parapedobacter tibetensis]|uniref:condensation domain-containing protein n=1 Tax=Parapedobacter tibetensis TaxID=2972951 RepID=UPI00214DA6F9|nr:condensation domain-containing protein [Parapedobacter tibetensis]
MTTTFARKLTMGERILHVDAHTSINCIFAAKIRGQIKAEDVKLALKKIQGKHPVLRMGIREDQSGLPHFVELESPPPILLTQLIRYTDDDWKRISMKEWARTFDKENGPLVHVVLLHGVDEVSELIWVCPHSLVDGVSCTALMRELLLLLDNPSLELDAYQLFGEVGDLLGKVDAAQRLGTRLKSNLYMLIARGFLWFKTGSQKQAASGESYFIHWKLDRALSDAIVATCKAEQTTVYAACCTAVLDAFAQVLGTRAKGKLICPVDIRRFIPAIKDDQLFAFAPITDIAKPPAGAFWERARNVKADLATRIEAMDVPKLLVRGERFHGLVGFIVKLLLQSVGDHDVTFSNMGRLAIPEHYDHFDVESIFSPTVGFPWRNPNTLVLSTYRGMMDFSLMSNTALVTEAEAEAIKEQVMHQLISAMSVHQEN